MKTVFAALFLFSFLSVGIQVTDACSVVEGFPGSVADRYGRSDVVFVGKVTSVVQDKSIYGDYRIQFEISKVYKGDFDHAVVVTSAGSSAACGYDDAYEVFKKGSVWAIYADEDLRTSGVVGNTEYKTVSEAMAELDAVSEDPKVCTMEYAPVCGRKDTGIRCVTTPCDSSEDRTYGNSCMLAADDAEFLHDGECRPGSANEETEVPSRPSEPEKPATTTAAEPEKPLPLPSAWSRFWTALKEIIVFWN